jgi:hypothetical protein
MKTIIKNLSTSYKILVAIAAIALIGSVLWIAKSYKESPEASTVNVHDALIAEIKPMFRLCTVEINEDYPLNERIGNKHIFAKVALRGSISFDIDNLQTDSHGDTLVVYLPKEIVDVKESTEPNSYQVIDTWNDNLLGSSNLTTAEENRVKERMAYRFRKHIYDKGYVSRARAEAVENLTNMLAATSTTPIIVVDTIK